MAESASAVSELSRESCVIHVKLLLPILERQQKLRVDETSAVTVTANAERQARKISCSPLPAICSLRKLRAGHELK